MDVGSIAEYIARRAELPDKVVMSNPSAEAQYRRLVYVRKNAGFQREAYTQTQVFHKNLTAEELGGELDEAFAGYRQVNMFYSDRTAEIKKSKSGKMMLSEGKAAGAAKTHDVSHDRVKQYVIPEGTVVPPLVDMGIFTKEGRIVASMHDKFRQINRFVEIVEDAADCLPKNRPIRILDFGCGKSYLTFILYYYFTKIRGADVRITGLDLKADVIRNCNEAARRYGYENLSFAVGDIGGYRSDEPADMVVTLHACDTATDYALFHAVSEHAKLILSVPCCQHEMNKAMSTESMPLIGRYGIVKERMAALMTDAIRANLLTACGYKTQVLEFVDLSHTPKNLLIRATACLQPKSVRERALSEAEELMRTFGYEQKLYALLRESGRLESTAELLKK